LYNTFISYSFKTKLINLQEAQSSLASVDEELSKLKQMTDQLQPLESPQVNYQQLADHNASIHDQYDRLIGELMVELENELQLQQLGAQIAAQMSKSNQEILKVHLFL
jgi:hypothetical protein